MWLETLPLLLVCWINLAWEELGQGAQGFTTCYCFIFLCIWLLWCSLCLICNHEMCPRSMYCYTACLDCINCSGMCACLPALCCWHWIVWCMHVLYIDSDVHSCLHAKVNTFLWCTLQYPEQRCVTSSCGQCVTVSWKLTLTLSPSISTVLIMKSTPIVAIWPGGKNPWNHTRTNTVLSFTVTNTCNLLSKSHGNKATH